MSIRLKYSFPLIVLLAAYMLCLPTPVHASPDPDKYQSHPTSNQISVLVVGTNIWDLTKAYDKDNSTFTRIDYGQGDKASIGYYQVITFATPTMIGTPPTITQVDLCMRYSAVANTKGETYEIEYYVGGSGAVNLVLATGAAHSIPGAGADVWASVVEPIDGTWTWTDVGDIKLRVVVSKKAGGAMSSDFNEYEAWVIVHTTTSKIYVYPASQTVSAPFSVDIRISDVLYLYGWEFKLNYTTAYISATSVTLGPFLNSSVGTANTWGSVIELNDTIGRVWVTQTIIGNLSGASGGGTLATIYFTADLNGEATLDLHDTNLVGYDTTAPSYAITHTAQDGTATVTAVPEFPFGATMEIAAASVIIYIWWRKRKFSMLKHN